MKKNLFAIGALSVTASLVHADVLFESNFNGHNVAVDSGYVKDSTGAATAAVSWTQDASVTAISDLTAITSGGGFVNQDVAPFSTRDTLKVNYNLNNGADQGFSLTFTVNTTWDLTSLQVVHQQTNGNGGEQTYTSDLNVSLSGGTLASAVTDLVTYDYDTTTNTGAIAGSFETTDFNFTGTTIGAGTYTLQVFMNNLDQGGAYATFDGITLNATAIPEPGSFALIAGMLAFASIMLRRRV